MAMKTDPMEQAMQEALESVERMEKKGEDPDAEDSIDADGLEEDIVVEADTQEETSEEDPTAAVKEQLLRLAADFENFRKRTRREQEDLRRYGIERVVRDMLPVLDNLERALAHSDTSTPLAQGVQMVAKQFTDTLSGYGVKGFNSIGQIFDPERHEAMSRVPTNDAQPGAVIEELEKGYMLHERLLRPAKVVVATPIEEDKAEATPSESGESETASDEA